MLGEELLSHEIVTECDDGVGVGVGDGVGVGVGVGEGAGPGVVVADAPPPQAAIATHNTPTKRTAAQRPMIATFKTHLRVTFTSERRLHVRFSRCRLVGAFFVRAQEIPAACRIRATLFRFENQCGDHIASSASSSGS